MNMGKLGALLCGLALGSTGCAYMFKGSQQEVRVDAIPAQADVRQENRYLGATPTTIEVDRNQAQPIVVSKDGFKEQHLRLKRSIDTPWLIWDVATCAVPVLLCLPLLADALSGGWASVDDEVRVKLDPAPQPASSPVTALAPPPPQVPPASAAVPAGRDSRDGSPSPGAAAPSPAVTTSTGLGF